MKDAKKILNQHFDELVSTLQNVLRYKTEKGAEEPGAPFGREVRSCLDYVLDLSKGWGLDVYNDDGYAGHVDLKGSGKQVLGILGHLDVVPSNPSEWKYPPYAAEIHDGKLYARGTMDDKGPMIACLYAVKALKEAGFEPSKTVRLIFGCDEETDMGCVKHYFATMPRPDVAFSPDGDFPVINREKGIYHFNIDLGKLPQGVTITAGDRANVVPSKCVATVPTKDVPKGYIYNGVKIEVNGNATTLSALGKAAHASTPDEGVNATHPVLRALAELYPESLAIQFLANKVCDTTGEKWGIILHDEQSGDLTCNLGVLRTNNGILTATVDIRFPISYNCDYMTELLRKRTPSEFALDPWHVSNPLYVPADSELVTTLMDVYNKATNSQLEPIAIGGGTYSRCLNNCVAFGPLFPNEEQTIHMPNECVDLANLKLMAEIFLDAIYSLAK